VNIIRNINALSLAAPQVVTVGVFDGFHLGHQKIVREVTSKASEMNVESSIITFDPPYKKAKLLTIMEEKLALLDKAGLCNAVVLKNTGKWLQWSAEYFIRNFLINKIHMHSLVIGEDFKFGKNRTGDADLLRNLLPGSCDLKIVKLGKISGEKISSSKIRECISNGKLKAAKKNLGRHYFFYGKTERGEGLGKKIGYPTINFEIEKAKLLPEGVFEAKAMLAKSRRNIDAICYIGHTVMGKAATKKFKVELHLLDYQSGIEEKIVGTMLVRKIRDTKKFRDIKSLKKQIARDIREILPK
jgi:riboflavin kinase/FMN adenylyltransferase